MHSSLGTPRLRGGMRHPSAGRKGYKAMEDDSEDKCGMGDASKFANIKYGPGKEDMFEIEMNDDETRESLILSVQMQARISPQSRIFKIKLML